MLDSKYDNTFKSIISAGWAVKSDGNVEAVTGYFALIELPSNDAERAELIDAVADSLDPDQLAELGDLTPGWFVSWEDSNGIIRVYRQDSQAVAEHRYADLERDYAVWSQAQECIPGDDVLLISDTGYTLGSWHTYVKFTDGSYQCSCGMGAYERLVKA